MLINTQAFEGTFKTRGLRNYLQPSISHRRQVLSRGAELRAGGTSGWEPSAEEGSAQPLMQRAGGSGGHTTRTKPDCNLALAALQETVEPRDAVPGSRGQSPGLGQSAGGPQAWMDAFKVHL